MAKSNKENIRYLWNLKPGGRHRRRSGIRDKSGKDCTAGAEDPVIAGWSDHGSLSRCACGCQGGMGEEYYFKVGLQEEDIRLIISIRSKFMLFGERKKYLRRFRSQRGPVFLPDTRRK